MATKEERQQKKLDLVSKLTATGEFPVKVTYKWTRDGDQIIFTTKNSYQGINSMIIPIKLMRDMLEDIDSQNKMLESIAIQYGISK